MAENSMDISSKDHVIYIYHKAICVEFLDL